MHSVDHVFERHDAAGGVATNVVAQSSLSYASGQQQDGAQVFCL